MPFREFSEAVTIVSNESASKVAAVQFQMTLGLICGIWF